MIGKIKTSLGEKNYGFITAAEGATDYFFHKSDSAEEWTKLKPGLEVSFDPVFREGKFRAANVKLLDQTQKASTSSHDAYMASAKPKKGRLPRYTGQTEHLTDEARRKALQEISRWKLEAKLDDVKRYFFVIPELNYIKTGDASYVIGRKGTGKTALVQFISEEEVDGQHVSKLTFKNFPFNELYKHENSNFTRPNQFITLWKLIIYSSACKLMVKSKKIDPLIRKQIEKAFPATESDNLSTIIGKWTAGDVGLNFLGSGVNLANWGRERRSYTIQQKVENLESFVRKHITADSFIILFDELDEDYKEIFQTYQKSEYIDLLTGLFKAIQDVRSAMGPSARLFPVAFLRDDIYDLIKDPDKNKWRDLSVVLEWRNESIRGLLAHRIAKVVGSPSENFDYLWYSLFSPKPIRYSGGQKEIGSFDFISMSTQGRPRDYINYLQECAAIELRKTASLISEDTVKDADKAYSNYLKKELIDEIHGVIPDIDTVFSIFSESRKWILSIDEFRSAYQERFDAGSLKVSDSDFVLRSLFYFSVVGNVARVDKHIFRHQHPEADLNFKEKLVVHKGLLKSLQIM